MLRGDLSFLTDEEKFFKNDFSNIVETIQTINSVYDKFTAAEDIEVLRADSNVDDMEEGTTIQYDNFISTSGSYNFINSPKNGVKGKSVMEITIPKGSKFIPMDLITERKMDSPLSSEDNYGESMLKTDECEILLPMSLMSVDKKSKSGVQTANISVIEQLDCIEILKTRIAGLRDKIIQYCGEEQYENILNSLTAQTREQSSVKADVLASAIKATEEVTTIGDIEQQAKNISAIERGTINKNTQAIE